MSNIFVERENYKVGVYHLTGENFALLGYGLLDEDLVSTNLDGQVGDVI